MTLGLDLSASAAKVQRAAEVLTALDSEARASIRDSHPVALIGDFDPQTGWLSVKARAVPREPRLSVILGEYIHDLRSALDYIVTALVERSGATLTRRHQFPIYLTPAKFAKAVGSVGSPKPDGPLGGVTHGVDIVELYQPYNVQPGAAEGALGLVQRLSNSDKHRAVVAYSPMPVSHQLHLAHNGVVIDDWQPSSSLVWEPDGDVELLRLRFAKPYPTQMNPKAEMGISVTFLDRAFPPDYLDPVVFTTEDLAMLGKQVADIVAHFEEL